MLDNLDAADSRVAPVADLGRPECVVEIDPELGCIDPTFVVPTRTGDGEASRPWDSAKGFDHSAPISAIRPVSEIGHPVSGRIWLAVNGEVRQDSDLNLQIWNVQEGISHLSKLYEVAPGDLIYTGTPDGVGPIQAGDQIKAGIDGGGWQLLGGSLHLKAVNPLRYGSLLHPGDKQLCRYRLEWWPGGVVTEDEDPATDGPACVETPVLAADLAPFGGTVCELGKTCSLNVRIENRGGRLFKGSAGLKGTLDPVAMSKP